MSIASAWLLSSLSGISVPRRVGCTWDASFTVLPASRFSDAGKDSVMETEGCSGFRGHGLSFLNGSTSPDCASRSGAFSCKPSPLPGIGRVEGPCANRPDSPVSVALPCSTASISGSPLSSCSGLVSVDRSWAAEVAPVWVLDPGDEGASGSRVDSEGGNCFAAPPCVKPGCPCCGPISDIGPIRRSSAGLSSLSTPSAASVSASWSIPLGVGLVLDV